MREDYKDWLKEQGYSDKTISTQLSQATRDETVYGPIEDVIYTGGYDSLFAELTYSSEEKRRNRPNPSRIVIEGNIRNSLASYKNTLARYARFLQAAPVLRQATVPTLALIDPGNALVESPEKQRLSLERDMQTALRIDIARLEPGLTIIDDGAERAVLSGFIDILARDPQGATVVIELKAGKTDARVIGQTLGYMGDMAEEEGGAVRGIIVAHDLDQRTKSAARAVSTLKLMRYAVTFTFQPVA